MNCASCGKTNRPNARFCGGCGQSLAPRCARCGSENAPDAKFCDACGTPLPTAPWSGEVSASKVVTTRDTEGGKRAVADSPHGRAAGRAHGREEIPPNAAVRASELGRELSAARDWAGLEALCAPGLVF